MALHIQMSEEAMQQLKKAALINKLISFGVCTGMLLLFGGILYFTILIIQGEIPAEFIAYTPPADDGPPSNSPVQKELTAKSATPSPTVSPSVIVAQNAVGAVAAPVSFDTAGDLNFDDLSVSLDLDSDLGDALGGEGVGLGSSTSGGSALEGTFYDLKLVKSGAPSRIPIQKTKDENGKPLKDKNGKPLRLLKIEGEARNRVAEALQKFFKTWNTSTLSTYYSSKDKLYSSSFYLPKARAEYAPHAYDCADVCQDAGWVCVYKGRVRAPKTGKFRFIGTGDDYIGVRFDKRTVLEAGYLIPSLYNKDTPNSWWVSGNGNRDNHWKLIKEGKLKGFEGYELISHIKEIKTWNSELGGLTAGSVFSVKEGQVYDIQIAISEIPGGAFGYVLFIEDLTDGKKVPPGGKYDLFRTSLSVPDRKKIFDEVKKFHCNTSGSADAMEAPPFNEDSPVWIAVP